MALEQLLTFIILIAFFFIVGFFVGAEWASRKSTSEKKDSGTSYKPLKCAQINCKRDAKNYGSYPHYCASHAIDKAYGM